MLTGGTGATSLLCQCGLPNPTCGVCGLGYNQRLGVSAATLGGPAPVPLPAPPALEPATPKAPPTIIAPAPPAKTPQPAAPAAAAEGPAPPDSSDEEEDDGKARC